MTRAALQINLKGYRLFGTHHLPDRVDDVGVAAQGNGRVGVLLFNPGALPRSALGDLSACLADHVAGLGYDAFRFDMPGLGDSPGELPQDTKRFFAQVMSGGHARWAMELIAILRERFALTRVVLAGHCGGAITAVFTAAQVKDGICGVIQLDPEFSLRPAAYTRVAPTSRMGRLVAASLAHANRAHQLLRHLVTGTFLGGPIRGVYRAVRIGMCRLQDTIKGRRFPERTNMPLIRCWQALASAGMPMLVLTSEEKEQKPDHFDYPKHLTRNSPRHVMCAVIKDTDHSFTAGNGREEVLDHVERWLRAKIPLGDASGRGYARHESAITGAPMTV